jgi:hypothetical protein
MGVVVHGLDPSEGETAFAFCALRFANPVDRTVLLSTLHHVAALIPDADAVVGDLLPDDLEQEVRYITIPWLPPEAGHGLTAQRRLIESTTTFGVAEAWFFQTGTSLPPLEDEDDDDTDDAFDDDTRPIELVDASGVIGGTDDDDDDDEERGRSKTQHDERDFDDGDDEDDGALWSLGPPPQVEDPAFPVDDYPAIIESFDREDFGITIKLAGEMEAGEGTVLLGFHTLWLAPYAGRYRNAGVRIDRDHHAAHFWVERFAVSSPADELVHHLLWVVSKLAEITPVVYARFVGATMAQKYAVIMGDSREPFVLGGNPLLAVYAASGEAGVDHWIEERTEWSDDEVAQMLRELAIEIATAGETPVEDEDDDEGGDDDDDDDGDEDDDDDDDDDDEGEADGNEDEDRGRQITTYALDLLRVRSDLGLLDPRAAERLQPFLPARKPTQGPSDDEGIN